MKYVRSQTIGSHDTRNTYSDKKSLAYMQQYQPPHYQVTDLALFQPLGQWTDIYEILCTNSEIIKQYFIS